MERIQQALKKLVGAAVMGLLGFYAIKAWAYYIDPILEAGVLHFQSNGARKFDLQTGQAAGVGALNSSGADVLRLDNQVTGYNALAVSTGNVLSVGTSAYFQIPVLTTTQMQTTPGCGGAGNAPGGGSGAGCLLFNSTKNILCVSTGTGSGAWINIATAATPSAQVCGN